MRTMIVTILVCCFSCVWGQEERWNLWKETYNKTYANAAEEAFRKNIFFDNCDAIDSWNERFDRGEVNFYMGENKYSDLCAEEFEYLKGLLLPLAKIQNNLGNSPLPEINLPKNKQKKGGKKNLKKQQNNQLRAADACTIDLRDDDCLTPIKDQGVCGSCYAFPATALAEFAYCKEYDNTQISFSEQQCVDCTRRYGNAGCNGGFYEGCFQHWQRIPIRTSNVYPYVGQDQACLESRTQGITTITGYTTLKSFDEDQMLQTMCTTRRPIAISIDASQLFNAYKSGVYDDPTCSNYLTTKSNFVNHAVTIVGAGVETDGTKYWIVRNSWGTSWGEEGYIRMRRGVNQCNLGLDPVMINF